MLAPRLAILTCGAIVLVGCGSPTAPEAAPSSPPPQSTGISPTPSPSPSGCIERTRAGALLYAATQDILAASRASVGGHAAVVISRLRGAATALRKAEADIAADPTARSYIVGAVAAVGRAIANTEQGLLAGLDMAQAAIFIQEATTAIKASTLSAC